MSEHKALRVELTPVDEAVTVDEATRLLGVVDGFVDEALKLGVLQGVSGEGHSLVRLDSLLEYQRYCAEHPRTEVDEMFDELEAAGLC